MNIAQMERMSHDLSPREPMGIHHDMMAHIMSLSEHERHSWVEHWRSVRESDAPMLADGAYYHDTRAPFMAADQSAVTLSTTDKALYTPSAFPVLGGQYFAFPGKKLKIRAFGKITTGTTPGNGTFDIYYGNGTDANGTIVASSGTLALSASQTNLSWEIEVYIRCATIGSAGTLRCTGHAIFNVGVLASTLAPMMIPASASADSGSVDLTAALILSIQFKRSGSTAETMTVQDLDVTAMN